MARRFRFSVRTLTIFVTLVCAYFGAWEATKNYGVQSPIDRRPRRIDSERVILPSDDPTVLSRHLGELLNNGIGVFAPLVESAPAPFVIASERMIYGNGKRIRTYYLWLLGPKFKLPFESPWNHRQPST